MYWSKIQMYMTVRHKGVGLPLRPLFVGLNFVKEIEIFY